MPLAGLIFCVSTAGAMCGDSPTPRGGVATEASGDEPRVVTQTLTA